MAIGNLSLGLGVGIVRAFVHLPVGCRFGIGLDALRRLRGAVRSDRRLGRSPSAIVPLDGSASLTLRVGVEQ